MKARRSLNVRRGRSSGQIVRDFEIFAYVGLLACLVLPTACSQGVPAGTGGAGGSPVGGAASGGASSGGSAAASGSGASGGAASGGAASGGAASGGGSSASGGNAAGGMSSGGAGGGSSGGAPADGFSTASALVESLTLGWNLGNSLDAPEGETAWGNPNVTPELLLAVAAAGFDAVRIPVTWSLHTGAGPDYAIDGAFLARVDEVVGYAQAAGLVAIINLHHDGADEYAGVEWLRLTDESGNVTADNNAAVLARFEAVWTQLAAHFQGHDGGLLFESMNEIHEGYDAPDPAYYDIITDLNQTFVDIVRQSGGNNAQRCLVVPGYNTNIDYTVAGFEPPLDTTPGHLILSVHYYDPWSFAGEGSTQTWGAASPGTDDWGQEDYVVAQYDKLVTSFVSQGIPMIVGEYGAIQQDGSEDYRRYYMEYVTKVMIDRGVLPFYWDNGGAGTGMDNFGLISRSDGSSLHPDILAAMMRAATEDYELTDVALPTP
jgi:endoglucanase